MAVSIAVGNGRNARRLVPYGGAVLVAFAVLTWQRGTDWQDELSLWLAASRHGGDEMFRVQGNLGLAHYDAGQLPQAVAALERAVELNPAYAKTWNNLGLAQEGAGRIEAASRAYVRARELNPELAGVYNNLARLQTRAGENENAAEHLRRALVIDPRYAPAHVNLGLAYQRMGDLALAESHYRQALGPPTKLC